MAAYAGIVEHQNSNRIDGGNRFRVFDLHQGEIGSAKTIIGIAAERQVRLNVGPAESRLVIEGHYIPRGWFAK